MQCNGDPRGMHQLGVLLREDDTRKTVLKIFRHGKIVAHSNVYYAALETHILLFLCLWIWKFTVQCVHSRDWKMILLLTSTLTRSAHMSREIFTSY